MIFVTVGAQMPFDRMITIVDRWAGGQSSEDCFAQIGDASYQPRNMKFDRDLPSSCYEEKIRSSRLVIAHAGMGSILTAMRLRKPILIFPRRAELQETRNSHQVATIRHFGGVDGIYVAESEDDLLERLSNLQDIVCPAEISPYASDQLIHTVETFIDQAPVRSGILNSVAFQLISRLRHKTRQ